MPRSCSERLKATRDELERLAAAEDADSAVEVLTELADLAKEVEVRGFAKARSSSGCPAALRSCAACRGLPRRARVHAGARRAGGGAPLSARVGRQARAAGDRACGRRGCGGVAEHCLPLRLRSSSCTRSRSSTTTFLRWTTTTSGGAVRPPTSRSARRRRSSRATRCSPRLSGSRSPTRLRWSAASSRRQRSG